MRYLEGFIGAVIIHLLLAILLLPHGDGKSKGKGQGKNGGRGDISLLVHILEKKVEPTKKEDVTKSKGKIATRKQKKVKKEECKDFYEGIGITNNDLNMINGVYYGYPAFNAGVLVGDMIISPKIEDIRGPKGTIVTLVVMRDAQLLTFHIVRDKICTDGKP